MPNLPLEFHIARLKVKLPFAGEYRLEIHWNAFFGFRSVLPRWKKKLLFASFSLLEKSFLMTSIHLQLEEKKERKGIRFSLSDLGLLPI